MNLTTDQYFLIFQIVFIIGLGAIPTTGFLAFLGLVDQEALINGLLVAVVGYIGITITNNILNKQHSRIKG